MSLCQICNAPMVKEEIETPTGSATLAVCSDWKLHPVVMLDGSARDVPKGSAIGVSR